MMGVQFSQGLGDFDIYKFKCAEYLRKENIQFLKNQNKYLKYFENTLKYRFAIVHALRLLCTKELN